MISSLRFFIFSLVIAISSTLASGQEDILLGAPLTKAEAIMAGKSSRFKPRTVVSDDRTSRIILEIPLMNERTGEIIPGGSMSKRWIAVADQTQSIWFTAQYDRPARNLSEKMLIQSLEQKYGPPSNVKNIGKGTSSDNIRWEYDRNGKQYFGDRESGPCSRIVYPAPGGSNHQISPSREVDAQCGKLIVADIHTYGNDVIGS